MLLKDARPLLLFTSLASIIERIVGDTRTIAGKDYYEENENIIRSENFAEIVHGHSRA